MRWCRRPAPRLIGATRRRRSSIGLPGRVAIMVLGLMLTGLLWAARTVASLAAAARAHEGFGGDRLPAELLAAAVVAN
jgi:hypothetical protein